MKKKIFILSLSTLATFSISSCKKEYVCNCKDNNTGDVNTYKVTVRTKTLAKKACETFQISGTTCTLN